MLRDVLEGRMTWTTMLALALGAALRPVFIKLLKSLSPRKIRERQRARQATVSKEVPKLDDRLGPL